MDLHDQYVHMEKTTQWRFTLRTHGSWPRRSNSSKKKVASRRGFILFSGKLTTMETLGCIGASGSSVMEQAVHAGAMARTTWVSCQRYPHNSGFDEKLATAAKANLATLT